MNRKVAIVTGASRGIGKAICQKLIEAGYFVYGISRSFGWKDPDLEPICLDLSDLNGLTTFLKSFKPDSLEAMICNAGQGHFGYLEQFSFSQIQKLMDVNFLSSVFLIKSFLPLLKSQENGDIIVVGSEAALSGKKQGSVYSATKFALRGFCQALREECATSSVRVSLINPGMVQTDFFEKASFLPGSESSESILPDDIAEAVLLVLKARKGTVFDEINLSPQKKRLIFKKSAT